MVNNDLKFVFVHIPKTGGTSIEKIFYDDAHKKDVPLKHETLGSLIANNPDLESYFKFSVVRNPWDIVCSLYSYMWKSDYPWPVKWRDKISESRSWILDLTFLEWVKRPEFEYSSLRSSRLFDPNPTLDDVLQSDWLVDAKGEIAIDFLLKFESLQKDFHELSSILKLNSPVLGHSLKSRSGDYRDAYDAEARKIVANKYKRDIELFGYEF